MTDTQLYALCYQLDENLIPYKIFKGDRLVVDGLKVKPIAYRRLTRMLIRGEVEQFRNYIAS